MKETSWEDCIFNNSAKNITPDIRRAKSLIETAKQRKLDKRNKRKKL